MRKSYLAIACIALAANLSSCSKSDSTDTLPTNYKIDGVQDVTLQPLINPSGYMQLTVSYVGKTQERVDLSLEGVPSGCGADISVTGGYPTFSSSVMFTDTSANPGTYPIKLVCNGSSTGKKSYNLNLTIKPEPDYGSALLGTYSNTTTSCSTTGNTYIATITASDKVNKILLNNFDNAGTSVYALVTNGGMYFTVPQQTVNGYTYSGSGSIYNGSTTLEFSYTKTSPSSNDNCYVLFTK
ncbi:hypothetical protein [Taibaiella soli]|uniref:DUF1735 domain-containing protein n=1 Tax=Taibaiella soli TaxID=1649169 RepID=A0A2W2AG53_9BACT|nr:hypothetical protein [Taibaiella soli]PZF72492.1 hypothetical protein DN068_11545 [Taibaiella soli]